MGRPGETQSDSCKGIKIPQTRGDGGFVREAEVLLRALWSDCGSISRQFADGLMWAVEDYGITGETATFLD